MKNDLLFATLSLVSSVSKYRDSHEGSMKGMEIEKTTAYSISGTYTVENSFFGIRVQNTDTEDYFYTFDLLPEGKVFHAGKEISFDKVKEGDSLKVTYDGSVSLVYPPKLNNVTRIDVIDSNEK